MKDDVKVIGILSGVLIIITTMLIGYNLYTGYENRKMYEKCLEAKGVPDGLTRLYSCNLYK